jgi:nucleotide-binding universal stress UspA family protein
METSLEAEGHALLTTISGRLGDPPPSFFVRAGAPADEIVAAAREWRADLIVTASHGRSGMPRLLLGSTAESVLRQAGCAVMVVKPEAP